MPHSIADRDSRLWTSGIIEKIGSVTNWPTELTLRPLLHCLPKEPQSWVIQGAGCSPPTLFTIYN